MVPIYLGWWPDGSHVGWWPDGFHAGWWSYGSHVGWWPDGFHAGWWSYGFHAGWWPDGSHAGWWPAGSCIVWYPDGPHVVWCSDGSVRCDVVMVEVEYTVPRTWRREASPRSCSSRPRRQWSSSWDKCSRSSRWSLPCPCTSSSSSSSPHSRQLLSPSCPPRWQQLQLSPLSCSPPRKSTSRSSLLLERCRAYRWVQVQVPKDLTARERSAEEKQ